MLRKFAAGTSAAIVAAGLAAAPAVAAGLPASPGAALPGGDPRTPRCSDAAQTEQNRFEETTQGFVFGPLAEVPYLLSSDSSCVTVASGVSDTSAARRHSSSPPPVGTPAPEVPSSPPPTDSGPEMPSSPPPGDSAPPPSAGPPADTSSLPAPPDFAPTTAPAPVAPAAPPSPRAELGGPGDSVLPSVQPPREAAPRLPQTAGETRPLTVAGGASLFAAGLAWIGGARRRRKRRPAL